MQEEWFSEWFDTPYYHILYKDRDDQEAEYFIDQLIQYLKPRIDARFLDLACGKGRHAKYLNSRGYIVDGCDLSSSSINEANKDANEHLHFFVQDMREPTDRKYDYIFNLFTSIGYFEDFSDNAKTFKAVAESLNPNGLFVVDFLNAPKVIADLVEEEEKLIEGIRFKISKRIEHQNIIKSIAFSDQGKDFHFEEKVSLLRKTDFLEFAEQCGMKLIQEFGNYSLDSHSEESERLILIFKKA